MKKVRDTASIPVVWRPDLAERPAFWAADALSGRLYKLETLRPAF